MGLLKRIFCSHLQEPLEFVRNLHGDQIVNAGYARSVWKCKRCGHLVFRDELFFPGQVSDGHHTFDELYFHRSVLFSAVCNSRKDISWKSKLHSDGTMYNDMFIVGINTPTGQATYHIEMKQWDLFKVKELDRAPEWDGHTPDDVLKRITNLSE